MWKLLYSTGSSCVGVDGRGEGRLKNEGIYIYVGFPAGSDSKESACNAGDPGLIPGSGRSPGEGNGNPLQYSCLKKPMDVEDLPGKLESMGSQKSN